MCFVFHLGPFTVFGVTDDGLSNLPIVIRERLVREKAFAVDFLKYHILPANVTSSQMTNGKVVKTLNGKSTCFNNYTVGGKKVSQRRVVSVNACGDVYIFKFYGDV